MTKLLPNSNFDAYRQELTKSQLTQYIQEFKPDAPIKLLKQPKEALIQWIRKNFKRDELQLIAFFDKYKQSSTQINFEKIYPVLDTYEPFIQPQKGNPEKGGVPLHKENGAPLKLLSHQKKFIRGFIFGNLRSAIVFHGTGTGKTITAVASARLYLQMYPKNRVIVITPSAVLLNFVESMLMYGVDPRDPRYTFWTFTKFYRNKTKNVKNALVIIDEAHNYRTAIKSISYAQDIDGSRTGKFKGANKKGQDMIIQSFDLDKVLMLTATPLINMPYDIENLLAIGDGRYPLSKTDFNLIVSSPPQMNDYFKYRISQHSNRDSIKFFPRRLNRIETEVVSDKVKTISANVSMINNEDKKNAFYTHSRQRGLDYRDWKFKRVIKIMTKKINTGKKFVVFTSFRKAGVKTMIDYLKNANITYATLTGSESVKQKELAKKRFNAYQNKNIILNENEKTPIQCLIITMAGKEGVNLIGTRAIFLLDIIWNDSTTEQIIARAIRFKSHDHLPMKQRYVLVHKMFTCYKNEDNALRSYKETGNKTIEICKLVTVIRPNHTPSTDFYLYLKQQLKTIEIEGLVNKIDNQFKVEDSITHFKGSKDLYNKVFNGQWTYKKFLDKALKAYKPLVNKSFNLYDDIKHKLISDLTTNIQNGSPMKTIKQKAKQLQDFFTPDDVVDELLSNSDILKHARTIKPIHILEPTAGQGSIVLGLEHLIFKNKINAEIDMVEYSPKNRIVLKQYEKAVPDILSLREEPNFMFFFDGEKYDYIFMNPPFHLRKNSGLPIKKDIWDIDFVMRAYAMLNDNGGQLCAIVSQHYTVDSGKKYRDWLKMVGATIHTVKTPWEQIKTTKNNKIISLGGQFKIIVINKKIKNRALAGKTNSNLLKTTRNLYIPKTLEFSFEDAVQVLEKPSFHVRSLQKLVRLSKAKQQKQKDIVKELSTKAIDDPSFDIETLKKKVREGKQKQQKQKDIVKKLASNIM